MEYDYICKEINSAINISENPNVEYIDLGPSISKNVIQAKGKYGFDYIDNWYDICYHLHGEDDDSGGSKKHQTFQYDDSTLLPSVEMLISRH